MVPPKESVSICFLKCPSLNKMSKSYAYLDGVSSTHTHLDSHVLLLQSRQEAQLQKFPPATSQQKPCMGLKEGAHANVHFPFALAKIIILIRL